MREAVRVQGEPAHLLPGPCSSLPGWAPPVPPASARTGTRVGWSSLGEHSELRMASLQHVGLCSGDGDSCVPVVPAPHLSAEDPGRVLGTAPPPLTRPSSAGLQPPTRAPGNPSLSSSLWGVLSQALGCQGASYFGAECLWLVGKAGPWHRGRRFAGMLGGTWRDMGSEAHARAKSGRVGEACPPHESAEAPEARPAPGGHATLRAVLKPAWRG